MKKFIYIFITLFALVACQDADELRGNGVMEGDIRVAVRVPQFEDVYVGTRGTKLGDESKVTNMYMFIIDNSSNIAYKQYEAGDKPLFTIDRQDLANDGKVVTNAKIIVIANATDAVKTALDAANNLNDLYACDFTLSDGTDCVDIPETGFPMMSEEYLVDLHQPVLGEADNLKGNVLEIPLQCLYAKIMFNISVEPTQSIASVDQSFQLKSWKVYNVPTMVNLKTPAVDAQTKFAESGCSWVASDARTKTNKADNLIYESSQETDSLCFYFYMPEHKINPKNTASYPWKAEDNEKYKDYRQYLKPTLVQDKTQPLHPCETDQKATYVEINGIFKDHNSIEREVTYTIYLGDDNYQNFHVLRDHQYNNDIIIKGIKNSTAVVNENWVTYDHRVNVKQDEFTFGLQRETLLDSHWEIRPIRIDFNNTKSTDAVVEVIIPNDVNWLSIESPSASTITSNATRYCAVDNTSSAYGKRRYYTTNLNTTLNGTKKIVIHRDAKKDAGHTIAKLNGTDAHTVWAYIDEFVNTAANAPQYRYATITCNYYASEAAYNKGKGTPTVSEDYIFRQNNLHKIVYNGHTYYIEYYEEYLYNYDSKEQYGNTSDGMEWGLNGVQLSTQYGAVAMGNPEWSSGTDNWLKNLVNSKIAEKIGTIGTTYGAKYDFYLSRDAEKIPNSNDLEIRDYMGRSFTIEIAKKMNMNTTPLATNIAARSAIEYALNRNKRNTDGTIDIDNIKWYLPAIDEIEEICMGGYGDFEVFQDKYYWSSQPANKQYSADFSGSYSLWGFLGNATVKSTGVYFLDHTTRARATKSYTKTNANGTESFGHINSGSTGSWGTLYFVHSGNARLTSQNLSNEKLTSTEPVDNSAGVTFDEGNMPRVGQKNRVRCVYKAN